MPTDDLSNETPPPANPGGSGDQTVGPSDAAEFIARDMYKGIGNTLQGLAECKPRSIGGNAFAALISSAVTNLEAELRHARESNQRKSDQIDQLKDELSAERSRSSSLAQLARSTDQVNAYSQVCMTIASILVGVCVDAFKSDGQKLALLTGVLAVVLLVSGWVIPRVRSKDNV